jgi:hypothetical protein
VKKADIIIGIDCDVDKSGVAFLEVKTKRLEATTLPFPELLDYLKQELSNAEKSGVSIILVVEAGWLIKSNWHVSGSDNRRTSAAKGNAAGRNHEVGRKIVECARYYGYEVIEQIPLRKHWKGKDGKITHEELHYFTGIMGRTNQESRDAALLCWHYAGLPIRIKTQ